MPARPLLSAATLAGLRTLATRAMQDAIVFTVPGAAVPDGRGGTTPGPATVVTSACRITPAAAAPPTSALGQGRVQADAEVWLPYAGPAVAVGATAHALGQDWHVIDAPAPDALAAYRVVLLRKGVR